jgi:hypothetical protein
MASPAIPALRQSDASLPQKVGSGFPKHSASVDVIVEVAVVVTVLVGQGYLASSYSLHVAGHPSLTTLSQRLARSSPSDANKSRHCGGSSTSLHSG